MRGGELRWAGVHFRMQADAASRCGLTQVLAVMEALSQLQHEFLMYRIGVKSLDGCIAWAIDRLSFDQEGDDLDIVLLAGSANDEEAYPYVTAVLKKHCDILALDEELVAGKLLVELHKAYAAGAESLISLDQVISSISSNLSFPSWLTMLSRNCEFAIDAPYFVKPFELEFDYIAGLWSASDSSKDFYRVYSRAVSAKHDWPTADC
jgi:hypothetical protein